MIFGGQQEVRGEPGRGQGQDIRRRCGDDSFNSSGKRVWKRPEVPPGTQLPSMFAAAVSVTPRRPSAKSDAKKDPSNVATAPVLVPATTAAVPVTPPTQDTSKAVVATAASTGSILKKKKKEKTPVTPSTPKSGKSALLSNRRDWSTPEEKNKKKIASQWKPESPAPATPSTVASSASYFSPTSGNSKQASPSQQRRYLGAPTPKSGKKSKVLSVFSKIPKRNADSSQQNENVDGGGGCGGAFNLMTPQERMKLARAFHAMEEERLLRETKPIDLSLAEDVMTVLRTTRNDNEFVKDEESSLSLSSDSDSDDDESVDISPRGTFN